jgi:formiminotetrahydrofolate cyclodeaminase
MAAAPPRPPSPRPGARTAGDQDLAAKRMGDLLDALASGSPAPGGGAAAALAGALAAALVAMVARVAALHDGGRPPLGPARRAADGLRRRLARLAAADAVAYARFVEARRRRPVIPRAVERALHTATEVPLAVAESARDTLALAGRLAPRARPSTRSDLAVAVHLANGALESGAVTARANLAALGASTESAALRRRLERAEREGGAARRDALDALARAAAAGVARPAAPGAGAAHPAGGSRP